MGRQVKCLTLELLVARSWCLLGVILLLLGCARGRPVGTVAPQVPAAPPPQTSVTTDQQPRRYAVRRPVRAPSLPVVPQESSRVRELERPLPSQPYVPRLEYDVEVQGVKPERSAARTEIQNSLLAQELEQLDTSNFVLRAPSELRVGETVTVRFAPAQDLGKQLQRSLLARGMDTAGLATNMVASLTSDDSDAFDIRPVQNPGNEWVWEVTSREAGRHMLSLNVSLTATLGEDTRARTFPAVTQPIVATSAMSSALESLFGKPWFWMIAVLALLAAMLMWVVQTRRRHA